MQLVFVFDGYRNFDKFLLLSGILLPVKDKNYRGVQKASGSI